MTLRNWIQWGNYSLALIAILLFLASVIMSFTNGSEEPIDAPQTLKRTLPKGSFERPQEAYDAIGKGPCDLRFTPISLQVPDLRSHLIYYGTNGRPDAQAERPILHFGFLNDPITGSVAASERLYLRYDRSKQPGHYTFSPDNLPTPLWIESTLQGNEAVVTVSIRNEQGDIIREPAAHANCRFAERDQTRIGGKTWELGTVRVDGSLLARQKARWMGADRFLERHGGEEYASFQGKHRIDFADDKDASYSVFVGLNDALIWKNNRWEAVKPGDASRDYPLLVVKKIDERIMNLELWNTGGKNKVVLNLIRSSDAWMPQNLQERFKFLGARTHSQYIFEVEGQRMILSPKDWLLQTEAGWIKLSTPEQIDDYVERRLTGVLFVFDGVERQEGRQVLMGVVFNPARTELKEMEIPVAQGGTQQMVSTKNTMNDNNDDDVEIDDDEDEPYFPSQARELPPRPPGPKKP